MKKHFVCSCLLLISITVYTQSRFGAKAGMAVSNFSSSSNAGIIPDYSIRIGYIADVFIDVPITTLFSIQADLQYFSGGAKASITDEYDLPGSSGYNTLKLKTEAKFRPSYLAIPVYFKVNLITGNSKLSLGAGPMAGYGIGGKALMKLSNLTQGGSISGEIKLFKKDDYTLENDNGDKFVMPSSDEALLKKLNLGLSGLLEYEIKQKIILGLSYHYGLRNISNSDDEELRSHNLSVIVGYKF